MIVELRMKIMARILFGTSDAQTCIGSLIDSVLSEDDHFSELHTRNTFKYYCFAGLTPIERDRLIKPGKIYNLVFRTLDLDLASYLQENLLKSKNDQIEIVNIDLRLLNFKVPISRIYSLTPVIIKDRERGYWREFMPVNEFEARIKNNLIKKYNALYNENLDGDFEFYTCIKFLNQKPANFPYKNIKLLGDKLELEIAPNESAQKIAEIAIGSSLGEMGARGAGFVNYKLV